MVEARSRNISQPPLLNKETIGNGEICCYNCELLKLKLQEVSSELSSAREIIKILQEEENPNQRTPQKPRGPQFNQEEEKAPTVDCYTNWTRHKPARRTRMRNHEYSNQEVLPLSVNRYNVLRTLIEPQTKELPKLHKMSTKSNENSGKNGEKSSARHIKGRKIIVIGDSHAKGCAANIKHILGNTDEVTGYVSPGAKLENITTKASKEITELTKKDTVVIWGGTNDIAKNESEKGLLHLSKFVELYKNTNVTIVSAPRRHDLAITSCVNVEVDKFNRKLHKKMRIFEHAKVIDSVSQRECYTRHGLHLNSIGKEQMAHRIIDQIKNLSTTNITPIPLPWKVLPLVNNPDSSDSQSSVTISRTSGRTRKSPAPDCATTDNNPIPLSVTSNMEASTDRLVQDNSILVGPRVSKRHKRPPIIKCDDFLW